MQLTACLRSCTDERAVRLSMTRTVFTILFFAMLLLPRQSAALPFTAHFAVTWESASANVGSGAILSFTVDNGTTSPLNQTYFDTDVKSIFVDSRPFSGTSFFGWTQNFSFGREAETLFVVGADGTALFDFALTTEGVHFDGPMAAWAPMPVGWVQFWQPLNMVRVSYVETIFQPPSTYRMGEISFGRVVVPNGGLIGTVPDETDTATLLLLSMSFAIALRLLRRRRRLIESFPAPSIQ